ncbi:hypothetical protein CPB84DRAFT_1764267 [Gymnopilus junonius]|uniref:Uncharacterized protein n=1 Tax=Gymnopilus junonius TaxID=109634 RepID=A0A9P5TT81_GYMJU|nr:hypothetical protein CPB84DRAFT_1764267 [Gymnopilus junonius]
MNSADLPIDDRLTNMSGPEIKYNIVRALRLDENWRRRVSKITRISKINNHRSVVDIQPLGREWLVISSRAPTYTIRLSLWRLEVSPSSGIINSSCAISFAPGHAYSFGASFEDGDSTALICVLGASTLTGIGRLTIYRINLGGRQSDANFLRAPRVINEWTIDHSGVFYHSEISGSIVAAAIRHASHLNWDYIHQILLFNTKTNVTIRIESPTLTRFDSGRMQFKIYSQHIVIVGAYQERVKVHVRKIPSQLFSDAKVSRILEEHLIPSKDWDSYIVDYETAKIGNLEFFISPEPVYCSILESFTVMVTHSPFSSMERGIISIYRFPIDTNKQGLKFTDWNPLHTFPKPRNVTFEPTCLGKTGRRAVWLSHQWNADVYVLMKASFGDIVAPLQPQGQALPFEPHTCQSLYFEEATGRLFVAVTTGQIYILEF